MAVPWLAQQGVYTAFCGLGFVLSYIPLYWHLEAWNMGTVLWIFWAGTGCLIYFINAIIWRDNVTNWAPVWCDIVTRFLHVQPIGICLASALINHRLYKLSKLSVTFTSAADKRKIGIIDLSIGLGVPAVFMGLYWFVQGHRFDIYEGVGCYPTTPITTVWLGTFGIWPTIISFVSACFGVATIAHFWQHRNEVKILLSASEHRNLTSYRYFRLMVFASVDVLFLLPFNIVLLFISTTVPFLPWNGLADLHFGFSFVRPVPAFEWQFSQISINQTLLPPGTAIGSCFVFFIFFGLAKEARVHYRKMFNVARAWYSRIRITPRVSSLPSKCEPKSASRGGILTHLTMPSFVQRVPTIRGPRRQRRRNSISSILSVSVTVEDLTVYDDLELGHNRFSRPELNSLKTVEPVYTRPEQALYSTTSETAEIVFPSPPLLPPGLIRAHASSAADSFDSRVLRTPPQHSFHGPKSVLSSTNSLDNL